MHLQGRVSPAERAGQRKRAPNPLPALTGPITITILTTTNPTSTVAPPPPLTTTATLSLPAISTTFTPPPPVFSTSQTQRIPVASIIPPSNNGNTGTGATSATDLNPPGLRQLPAGAIVGIVIGAVLILLAVVILLVRSRFQRSREQRRTTWFGTRGRGNGGSFGNAEKGFSESAPPVNTYSQPTKAPTAPPSSFNPVAAGFAGAGSRNALPSNQATVKFTFIPSLPDELSISNGEVVTIIQEFDDGWALCANGRDMQGMVPLECLARGDGAASSNFDTSTVGDFRNSRRSSLNFTVPSTTSNVRR